MCHAGRQVTDASVSRCTPRRRFSIRRRSGLWCWFIGEEGRFSRETRRKAARIENDLELDRTAEACPCLNVKMTTADKRGGGPRRPPPRWSARPTENRCKYN